jgi:hypothetical protein
MIIRLISEEYCDPWTMTVNTKSKAPTPALSTEHEDEDDFGLMKAVPG